MNKITFLIITAVCVTISFWSCSDSSPLGTDLVDDGRTNIIATDTFTVQASTVDLDSVFVYSPDPALQLQTYLLGNFDDPVFGNTKSTIYTQLGYSISGGTPSFEGGTFDSAVLWLAYDTTGFYGNTDQEFEIEISEIIEPMDSLATYYSNQQFMTTMTALGTKQFVPNPDSTVILISRNDTTTAVPHLRIKLNDAFGQRLMNIDSTTYADEQLFLDNLKGIQIKATSEKDGMLAFNLFGATRLSIYYSRDTVPNEYFFVVDRGSVRLVNYEHNLPSNIKINDPTDSIVYTQGMAGPTIKIDLPTVNQLADQNVVINQASITATVARLGQDDPDVFESPVRLELFVRDSNGALEFIEDLIIARNFNSLPLFDGILSEGTDGNGNAIQTYTMNISTYLQDAINGMDTESLYLRVVNKDESSSRVALYGPEHDSFPMKLNITYTVIN